VPSLLTAIGACVSLMILLFANNLACSKAPAGMAVAGPATEPSGPASPPTTAPAVPYTKTPLVIDGALDEDVWKSATAIPVDHVHYKKNLRAAANPMNARYAYDENYLYIGYETFEKQLLALGTGNKQGPTHNQREGALIFIPNKKVDVVEFFIAFDDLHFMWEIHLNAANQFNDIFCIVPNPSWPVAKSSFAAPFGIMFFEDPYLPDDGKNTLKTAVRLKPKADGTPATLNDSTDNTGYTAEIRIPWRSLGAPQAWAQGKPPVFAPAGHEFSILAVCQDAELPDRYHTSVANLPDPWFHKCAPQWPRYTLGPKQ